MLQDGAIKQEKSKSNALLKYFKLLMGFLC
jgi:hypothetical protein